MLIMSSVNILDAAQATITEAEDYACMDDDNLADVKLKSRVCPDLPE
jgi:hypothetical protein